MSHHCYNKHAVVMWCDIPFSWGDIVAAAPDMFMSPAEYHIIPNQKFKITATSMRYTQHWHLTICKSWKSKR